MTTSPISYTAELQRKALHLLALVVPLGMALLGRPLSLLLLLPLTALALLGDVLRVRAAWFLGFIERFLGFMIREEERRPLGGSIVINGATWVLITASVLTLIFPLGIAVASLAMFMMADAAAALIGRRFGRHPWPGTSRTIEGSLAFVAVGLGVMLFFPDIAYWIAALSVGLACLAEVVPRPLNDNFRVPIVTATTIFVLERFVLGYDLRLFTG